MKNDTLTTRWLSAISIACVIVATLIAATAFAFHGKDEAKSLIRLCASAEEPALCYEREVPKLFPKFSLAEIFEIIRQIRLMDPTYQFCHVLAHNLGRDAVANDPAHWIDLVPQNPYDGLCSNGFIHGVIIGRFRDAVLSEEKLKEALPDLMRTCEPRPGWNPSTLDRSICYHGMGHLFDYITNADLAKALTLCKKIDRDPEQDFEAICVGGVFMQMYQPLEPEDFELIKRLPIQPDAQNYRRMCAEFEADAKAACLREAWPLFYENLKVGNGVEEFCSGQPNVASKDLCIVTVATIIGRQMLDKPEAVALACNAFPAAYVGECFLAGAQAVIEEDRTKSREAVSLCKLGPASDYCLRKLLERRDFLFTNDAPERARFCEALPSSYRADCK